MSAFDRDPYPGEPKILFIGHAASTHAHAWIDLLKDARLNVRLFGLSEGGLPPDTWNVPTYVTALTNIRLNGATRRSLYLPAPFLVNRMWRKVLYRYVGKRSLESVWLGNIVRRWQPDIIHTLGLNPASYCYYYARQETSPLRISKWVVQLRGGSDLTLARLDPDVAPEIGRVLNACDLIINDNIQNIRYLSEMGIPGSKFSLLTPVPGTGGVDVDNLSQALVSFPPSKRRVILWPKAYDCPWSVALPVFEALQLAWDDIQPCEIYMLAVNAPARMWFWSLPEKIRRSCYVSDRIPREKVLELVRESRVVLAPSLIDGVPNTLYEAMAAGAFPIVSPLETIATVVKNRLNVLFARNLYPHEIAEALVRAMNDDRLVEEAAQRNLKLVHKIANRATIGPRVVDFYRELAAG